GGAPASPTPAPRGGRPRFEVGVLPGIRAPPVLVGTTAIFFAVVNWIKVPAYLALGQFTAENLTTAAVLAPLAIASTLAGVWLVRRIQPERFYLAIYVLMVLVGLQLLWKAFAG
ncbi:MAG TPA: sulfite exporter TauE/SafE family protein, partial [Phenylobacterium sp.]|nr:sulfite exporter TauE/SafE family protein [Phenylobacterium sp.]